MKISRLFSGIFILSMTIAGLSFGSEPSEKPAKLHPFFSKIISEPSVQLMKEASGDKLNSAAEVKNGIPLYNAIVYTHDADKLRAMGIPVNSVFRDFITTRISAADIKRISELESVNYLDPGNMNYTNLETALPDAGVPLLHAGFINNTQYKGNGVIVVIYDSGIDWKHFDFRKSDTTKSRILFIWDQTLTPIGGESSPSGFSYGVEYTQTQIEDELDGSPAGYVREVATNGHGTHVASMAAGNGNAYYGKYTGVAPEADIIVVKGGNASFSETNMIDGLTYAQTKANLLSKPMAFNWSIGGHGGPHDGTRPYEVAVDAAVATPGHVVCISAGNDGSDTIHISGSATSSTPASFTFTIPSYAPYAGTSNDIFYMGIWLPADLNMTINVTSPNAISYTRGPGTSGTGPNQSDGTIEMYNYVSSINSHRVMELVVYDVTANTPRPGTWTVNLTTTSATPVTFDGWIAINDLGGQSASMPAGDANKTIGMPGTSNGAITVGAYVTKSSWPSIDGGTYLYGETLANIASFSSHGPTGDNRQKPDISAPGSAIVAALSSNVNTSGQTPLIVDNSKYWIMQGTSMSCPFTTGSVALMLQADPTLTAAEVKSLITSTANSDSYATGLPNYIWGYGKLDVAEALAKSLWPAAIVTRNTLAYDGGTASTIMQYLTGNIKFAVRFTPTADGQVTGVGVNLTTIANQPVRGGINVNSDSISCEVYTNSGGFPGTKIGQTAKGPLNHLTAGMSNYIQMLDAGVNVTSGTDYHLVISTSSPTDSLRLRYESTTPGTRSSIYNGSTWSAFGYNIRIRPIVTTTSGLTGVEGENVSVVPEQYSLDQNYPNPFNPSTKIKYEIPYSGNVKLQVFDILGRLISTLVNTTQDAGKYEANWMGRSDSGVLMSSGVYFYRLQSGSFTKTERMLLLK